MKKAVVMGAGGFIGSHMVNRLKNEGYWVRGVDLKHTEFSKTSADEFIIGDLRDIDVVKNVIDQDMDLLYQFAADMGGAGYIFTGDNDANVMHNSGLINFNVTFEATKKKVKKVFYSSSACMYPAHNQEDPENPMCAEHSAYPAAPDSEYGWEKLFSERLYMAFARNYGLNIRIGRFHNIFGPDGTWDGGKEKAPAAMCRKAALAKEGSTIEVWGDGLQTRSFLYIDECIEAVQRLMDSDFKEPVNIGSEEMVSINELAQIAIDCSGKDLTIKNLMGEEFEKKYGFPVPEGVRGRNSDNELFRNKVNYDPKYSLKDGMKTTFDWILQQID
jgi:GDP-D-mannose 3',5'-epimerase